MTCPSPLHIGRLRANGAIDAPRVLAAATFLACFAGTVWPLTAVAAEQRPGLSPCRLDGVEHAVLCGTLRRPLDPSRPGAADGTQIDLHYAVLPALARNRKPDPVFFFAGGPGQSAMSLAGPVGRMLQRLNNRRDVVLVDQRGTGSSAPLLCDQAPATEALATAADPAVTEQRLRDCRTRLQALPHGDLRFYTTWIAVQDADAVRQALGATQIDLVGGSYGTRAALEYLRQFPQVVRRVVIDGVAPPDMVLPEAFDVDNQAALDAMFAACAGDTACKARYPQLRAEWQALLASLPRKVRVLHPTTGQPEAVTVTRDMVLGLARAPLYAPALAAGLPMAIGEAGQGRFEALFGLAAALGGGSRSARLSEGMHFSVVCAEDVPRMAAAAASPAAGDDLGNLGAQTFAAQYRRVCADWPRGAVPAAFYTMPTSPVAVLLLSGGADPATPPRHAARAAAALGPKARHVLVPQAGHGTLSLGCMRDVVYRFIDAASDDEALRVDADCAKQIPRPPALLPLVATPLAAGNAGLPR